MKRTLFFLALFTLVTITKSQNTWAPIGATWTYGYYTTAGDTSQHTCYIKSVRDTVIQGKQCRVLIKNGHGCDLRPYYEYMYSDSGRVYFYDTFHNTFQLLFDINTNVGGHFSTKGEYNDSIVSVVDSVSTIIINGHSLRKLSIHISHAPPSLIVYGGKIIENIGNIAYMFHWENFTCNEFLAGPLGCYSDTVLGFYDWGTIANCTTSSIVEPAFPSFSIYPNPNNGKFTITVDSGNCNISVYDICGKLIQITSYYGKQQNISIDLTDKSKGIYFVKLQTDHELITKKIILQ